MNHQNTNKRALDATYQPFFVRDGDLSKGVILTCDHASNHVPAHYNSLGLPAAAFERHIAYDIGVRDLTYMLCERLNISAVLSNFSRLLIDPNRGEDDPTLIMKISDGQPVPHNVHMSEDDRQMRLDQFHRPYHRAITSQLDRAIEGGKPPVILSLHSFTPIWRGVQRPWEAAVLWDNDPRFALPFLQNLRDATGLTVGDNEPYTGRLKGDALHTHGTSRGLAHCLLEIRQDLLTNKQAIEEWCEYIINALEASLQAEDLYEIKQFGSQAK